MLKPLNDHIIVKAIPENEKTASGILLPEINKEKPEKGEIIAVGPGRVLENGLRVTPGVTVGQKVIFTKYSPNNIKVDGQEYLILSESDILAILD